LPTEDRKRELQARLLATFREEADEHLQTIRAGLFDLQRDAAGAGTRGRLEATFRAMHTLKGAARSVSFRDVEAICQACETVLSRLTRDELAPGPEIVESLEAATEAVSRLLAGSGNAAAVQRIIGRLERVARAPRAAPAPVTFPPGPAAAPVVAGRPLASAETVRVATDRLDSAIARAEELLVPKFAAEERVRDARVLVDVIARARSAGGAADTASALRTLETQARTLLGRLAEDQRTVAHGLDRLLEDMRQIRMMPAGSVLDVFPLMVRDLARARGKDVEWAAQGAHIEIDRRVLETVKDPLIHLVRNAIDHGIEPPEVRRAQGKRPTGRVAVTIAPLEGGRAEIRVEDDGCGIDLPGVREAAVRARLLASEAAGRLTDDQALDLVFRSGLSTSPMITDVSGHGLGLAIVRERVERLDGRIELDTRPGAGTTVRMTMPASIATFRGLLVRAAGQRFLVATDAVERVMEVEPGSVTTVEGREVIAAGGRPLALVRLAQVLALPETGGRARDSRAPCVITHSGNDRAAVLVDDVLGEREVLVKALRPPLVRVRYVAGAGLLGAGEVVLILRPTDLVRAAGHGPSLRSPAREREGRQRLPAVLVVDDSITTRTVERNLLEAAGYRVSVAVDGSEAWTLLGTEEFDIVVSDVDMPHVNGFELTSRIRADQRLAELPVVLVTALESREDKERGIQVGANAYVIKSSLDQSNLLEIIQRFL
jgi:two-component system chemotaxis sensor kinase CheA